VPSDWPGAFGVYKYSRDAVKVNLGPLIILLVIQLVLSSIQDIGPLNKIGPVFEIFDVILVPAQIILYLAGVRRQQVDVGKALSESLQLILKIIGLGILVGATVFIGFLLLIVPGLYVLPRLLLAPYYLIDRKLLVLWTPIRLVGPRQRATLSTYGELLQ
jgi:hypothetical protein